MKKIKKRYLFAVLIAVVGLILTTCTYFATAIYSKNDVAVVTDSQIKDTLEEKSTDVYGNKDETRRQVLHLKVLSGKFKGQTYKTTNMYYPSQLVTQKFRAGQRLFVNIKHGEPIIQDPKRDWVLVLAMTVMTTLLVAVSGKKSLSLIASMILSWVIFYLVIMLDIKLNGS